MARARNSRKTATKKPDTRASAPRKRVSSARSGERRPDHDLVAATVERLVEHDARSGTSELEIGEHVLDVYFGGDPDAARSKSPHKPKSYRLLAERAELETSWDEADLRRAVTMAVTYRSLASAVRAKLPATYLLELGKLEDLTERQTLAARIAAGQLRGEEAREAITAANARERAGGRPPAPVLTKLVNRLARVVARARAEGALRAAARRQLDDEQRATALAKLRALRDDLDELLRALD